MKKSSLTCLILAVILLAVGCRKAPRSTRPLLHQASRTGDIQKVKSLIAKRTDINAKDKSGNTPLHEAARRGHREIVELLLTKGAEVNIKNFSDNTPLYDGCGHSDVVELLIAKGADVNAQNKDGDTILLKAIRRGFLSSAELLLYNGADVNAKDKFNNTPLIKAIERIDMGRVLIDFIIAKGADVNAANKYGDTPLIMAAKGTDKELVAVLIDKSADVHAKGLFLNTPLHWAAERGYMPIVKLLVENGANVNAPNRRRETPATLAVNAGHVRIVEYLVANKAQVTIHMSSYSGDLEGVRHFLEEGVYVNSEDNDGRTALHYAVEKGHVNIVRLLLANGADPNLREHIKDAAPLHLAVEYGHEDVTEVLIAHGADVNAEYGKIHRTPLHMAASLGLKDTAAALIAQGADVNSQYESMWHQSDWTPLHYAAERGHLELVQLLIDNGATVNQKDRHGNTAAIFAMLADRKKIVEILLAHGAEATIDMAVYIGDLEKTKKLLASDVDINKRDWRGCTLLETAAQQGHVLIMEELIANGSEVNILDPNDPEHTVCPALHFAAIGGNAKAVQLLLSHGANLNSKDNSNLTPLHMAAYEGHKEVVELLLTKGADINAQDYVGSTSVYLAAQSGCRDVVELLLTNGADIQSGRLGRILTLPDPAAHSIQSITEKVIAVCKPYSIIVSDPISILEYLSYNMIDYDDIWIPEKADIEQVDPALKSHLEKNIVVGAKEHFNPAGVLAQLYRYNREYSGFIKDKNQYVICQMIYQTRFLKKPPDNTFTNIHGFANNIVRFVFGVESKKIVQIDCEYIM